MKKKKQKALEDMSHQDLFEALIYDENIQDNMHVANDYGKDEYGNSIITMSFEEKEKKSDKTPKAIMIFSFNRPGRLVKIEVATKVKNKRAWNVVRSENFVDFSPKYDVQRTKKNN